MSGSIGSPRLWPGALPPSPLVAQSAVAVPELPAQSIPPRRDSRLQEADPGSDISDGPQAEQDAEPAALNWPAAHTVQLAAPPAENWPAGH